MAFEVAESHGYYEKTVAAYQERMRTLNKVWDELGLPVNFFHFENGVNVVYGSAGGLFCYG